MREWLLLFEYFDARSSRDLMQSLLQPPHHFSFCLWIDLEKPREDIALRGARFR
jgi:hypothetical protein